MQYGSIRRGCRDGINHARKDAVLDLDRIERILGAISIGSENESNRLADEAHPVRCQTPVFERGREPEHEGIGQRQDLLARDGRNHARRAQCGARIDGKNIRMRMRGTQDGGVQSAGLDRQIIDEAGATAQKRGIFQPQDRFSDQLR
jgi:hypothetical protein